MVISKKGGGKSVLLIFGCVFVLFVIILTIFYAEFSSQGKGTAAGDALYGAASKQKGSIYELNINESIEKEQSWLKELLKSDNQTEADNYEDLRTQEYEDADIRLTSFINVLKGSPKLIFVDLFGFPAGSEWLLFLGIIISLILLYLYWDTLKGLVGSLIGRG